MNKIGYSVLVNQKTLAKLKGDGEAIVGIKSVFDADAAPAVTDDVADGWEVGSRWFTTGGLRYECTNNAIGAAVWRNIPNDNIAATGVTPDADNDIDEGYTPGSKWMIPADGEVYICLDNSDGAAVWEPVHTAA